MNVFKLRDGLVADYSEYVRSYIQIRDERVRSHVTERLNDGMLWPEPLIQLNPSFEPGAWIDALVQEGVLHAECAKVFRKDKTPTSLGDKMRLHRHQEEAARVAKLGVNYVLTTGTGSGKSLAYIVPIVDHVLRRGSGKGIQAIIIYPMNALANSQNGELTKFLCHGYPNGQSPVRFAQYTGQEDDATRDEIVNKPPDILLTNYVMLEYILTRPFERKLIDAAKGLRFLVLDELHTYRGRQGADVAMLVRRVKNALSAEALQIVGTSATLAGAGTFDQQRQEVAAVASRLFGSFVQSEHVIGETLRRTTPLKSLDDPAFVQSLKDHLANPAPATSFDDFVDNPLSIWIESTLGLQAEPSTGRLVRATPRRISGPEGAALALSQPTEIDVATCEKAIQESLMAGYQHKNPDTGFPAFAFRLHQFISKGDTVYASLEPEAQRYVTTQAQQFVPDGSRDRILLPLAFCRECGQEVYTVRLRRDQKTGRDQVVLRELNDRFNEDDSIGGFIYFNTTDPWPEEDSAEFAERLPDDWVEEKDGALIVRRDRRKYLPQKIHLDTQGQAHPEGLRCHFIPAPFRFCPCCRVTYGLHIKSDYGALAELSTEGRSTATTILTQAAILALRREGTLKPHAQKLLSFTDNRQDAALQAGHFNDFIEISLIRAALYQAVLKAGTTGIRHEELTHKVFEALSLPKTLFAVNPDDLWEAAKQKTAAKFDAVKTAVSYEPDVGKENIEHLLSRCQISERLRADLDVEKFISDTEEIIVSKCRFVNDGLSLKTHEAFLRKIARRSTRLPRLRLFTTNYDLCFEAAASRTRFIVIDGFSHSMPQEFDGGYFSYDLVKRRDDREAPDYITNVFHLYKLHGSVDWCRAGIQVQKAAKPDKPLIIYPRESKFELSYDQPFLELMSRLQMALRQANTGLLVVGFGFNDQHIAQPLLAAMKSNVGLKAMVVSPVLENAGNPTIAEIAQLVREGDPRLALVETGFENLVSEMPDLVAATEEEQHMERLRNLGGGK